MRIVLVLGAGATLAQALHLHRQGHSGEEPPLDTTFFDRIGELKVDVGSQLRRYTKQVLGSDPSADDDANTPGMEAFFKDVFYDFINDNKKGTPAARFYGELLVAYRSVLLKTTNWICPQMSSGPIASLLASAAARANNVDVITFNHDLLVENALTEVKGLKSRWCLRHGYGTFAHTREFTSPTSKPFDPAKTFRDRRKCEHPDPIRVFKLHGSLNASCSSAIRCRFSTSRRRRSSSARSDATRSRHIDVVNPDPVAASRYAEVFSTRSVHWHPDLQSFQKGAPPL